MNAVILFQLFACMSNKDSGNFQCDITHTVSTTDDGLDMEVYMNFDPEDLVIGVGDCVNFVMSETHNAIEVSQESYESREGTPIQGGFEVQFGEVMTIEFNEVGTHYYVCQPHIAMDMVGTITVQ